MLSWYPSGVSLSNLQGGLSVHIWKLKCLYVAIILFRTDLSHASQYSLIVVHNFELWCRILLCRSNSIYFADQFLLLCWYFLLICDTIPWANDIAKFYGIYMDFDGSIYLWEFHISSRTYIPSFWHMMGYHTHNFLHLIWTWNGARRHIFFLENLGNNSSNEVYIVCSLLRR